MLVSLVVIFVPMLLEKPDVPDKQDLELKIPEKPIGLQRKPQEIKALRPEPIRSASRSDQSVETVVEPTPKPELKPAPVTRASTQTQTAGDDKTPASWSVQVGSFSNRDNATKLVEKLKKAGIPSRSRSVSVQGKTHYRVYTYPQLDKRAVEKNLAKIQKEFVSTAKLIRYTGPASIEE